MIFLKLRKIVNGGVNILRNEADNLLELVDNKRPQFERNYRVPNS